ncbi:MAG: LysR family transcriptional regulator [Gammaproteobacteria bacterium]|nr:LysR family transcriptional regulator [Gammaproteobacteria bacterium]
MDTIEGMRTFVAAASNGSFSRAADRLGMSPQLASKYVGQLEARLGVRLLNRSTRRLSITEVGQAYYVRCQQVLADIDEMEESVGELTATARGTLRINAPMSFGILHLSRAIVDYQRDQADVRVDLTLNDRFVDIVDEGFDLAIRIGRLAESSLIARELAPVRLVVCGAPAYFRRHGIPDTPHALSGHACLGYTYWSEQNQWRFVRAGETIRVRIDGPLSANNGDALRMAAVAGGGIILQPTFIVGDDIRAGRLQVVLEDYPVEVSNVHAVYPHRQYLSAKVRTCVDFLSEYFGSPPYWDRTT